MVHYLITVFPGLYEKLSKLIPVRSVLLKEISDEITADEPNKDPNYKQKIIELKKWIADAAIAETAETNDRDVKKLHDQLIEEYQPDKTKSGSVSENDLLIIAYAMKQGLTVVTYESMQDTKPLHKYKYKIPLICQEQNVRCIAPAKYFEELKIRI